MRFRHLLAASLCLATALPASAQTLRRDEGPVNFPPSSFTGTQFVDNRGCVYIRAGFQGAVTWVPRVGRDRRLLCGQTPTFPGSSAAAAAPEPAPAPRQTRQTATAGTASTPESQPRQTTRPSWLTRTPSPAPGPTIVSRPAEPSTRVPSAAVVTVREAPIRTITSLSDPVMAPAPTPTVAPAPVPRTVTRPQSALPVVKPMTPRRGLSVCPNRTGISAQHTNTVGVRCGPQAEDPRGTGGTLRTTTRPPLVEDIRRRVGADPAVLRIEGGVAPIPKGYEPVFKDGRHNPNRGLPGGAASLHSGSGVYSVSARGTGPYVQAATFASSANARATVARLSSMGLPVSTRSVRSGGRTLTVVLAGPFSDASSRNRALQQVRAAGFRDAFARR